MAAVPAAYQERQWFVITSIHFQSLHAGPVQEDDRFSADLGPTAMSSIPAQLNAVARAAHLVSHACEGRDHRERRRLSDSQDEHSRRRFKESTALRGSHLIPNGT